MLYIYTKLNDISKNNYINDIELFFENTWKKICRHPQAKYIIQKIDGASFINESTINTKFGVTNILNLSTGCKALLIAVTYNTSIVNFIETGNNVFNEALNLSEKYDINIYLPYRKVSNNFNKVICLDGNKCNILQYMMKMG